jgi:hypothetical protein
VLGAPGDSIQLANHDLVSIPDKIEHRGQFLTVGPGPGGFFLIDLFDTGPLELVNLHIEALAGGADSGIPNNHDFSLPFGPDSI